MRRGRSLVGVVRLLEHRRASHAPCRDLLSPGRLMEVFHSTRPVPGGVRALPWVPDLSGYGAPLTSCRAFAPTHHARSHPSRSLGSASRLNLPCKGCAHYHSGFEV